MYETVILTLICFNSLHFIMKMVYNRRLELIHTYHALKIEYFFNPPTFNANTLLRPSILFARTMKFGFKISEMFLIW